MDGIGEVSGAGASAFEGTGAPLGRRATQPKGKWTADTEAAFLLALRLCGQPKKAAAEIGRSASSVYSRRKHNPDFARRWDEAVAEHQREWIAAHQERLALRRGDALDDGAGGGRLAHGRERKGGWDARKRGLFLRTLKRTKRIDAACEAAEMSAQRVSDLRGRSPRFSAACEKALAEAAPPSVLDAALKRAVEGWEEPIVHGGKVVGHKQVFSEGLLRDLLRGEQERKAADAAAAGKAVAAEAARAAAAETGRATEAELTEAILHKLALFDGREREKARLKAERRWARWRLGWVDPALAAPAAGEDDADEADWDEADED